MKCFSIFDSKANVFNTPFFAVSAGVASRNLCSLVLDPSTTIAKYPMDFALYELGDYDETNGFLCSLDKPHHVCNASEFVANPPVAVD